MALTGQPEFDIIIIGAGPAGAMLAWQLVEPKYKEHDGRGILRVLLVDKLSNEEYSKYHKKCGEGISERGFALIKPCARIIHRLDSLVEHWVNASGHTKLMKGYIIDRPETLRSMIDAFTSHSGHITSEDYISCATSPDGSITVIFSSGMRKTCRLLVGADGPNSRVRRSCDFGNPRLITVVQYVLHQKEYNPTMVEMWYHPKFKGGYRYSFPSRNNTVKVGFIRGTDKCNEQYIETHARQLAWGGLPFYYKDGVILIGDAAGQCNPLTGGGMRIAFFAGKKLAEMIVSSIKNKEKDKTTALRESAKKFNSFWRTTPYESRKYISAHNTFEKMSSSEFDVFSSPLRKNNPIAAFMSLLVRPRYWALYKSFMDADKYAW
jgi:digeranylgeranylglycerophospholipid reductase